ncbi:four helix bundle protein [Candidatus Falkowbacteria bacterium]|nr:four helix bundle protein [Candidatus Falkowbacteria bacterium]
MNQFDFHNSLSNLNANEIPIITKFNESYKLWHAFLIHIPRLTRYTLGAKIDNFFTECLELSFLAGYSTKDSKLPIVQKLSAKFDCLKFFLKLIWEIKSLDNNKYIALMKPIAEVGNMIGGWQKSLKKQTLPTREENKKTCGEPGSDSCHSNGCHHRSN